MAEIVDPNLIFLAVVKEFGIDMKWSGQPFEKFKQLPNTNKGDAGERFIKLYGEDLGLTVEKPASRLGDIDLKINGKDFEVKLATEDVSGSFQFNHIRLDYKYDFLLCVGVAPDAILFDMWTKAHVATAKAGNLVSMGRGQNSSFKLTKKREDLRNINEFKKIVLARIA